MQNHVIIRPVSPQQTVPVRHQVLWPHKPASFCLLEDDQRGAHYGAFVENKLVCVASLFENDGEVRLRKFATLDAYQGQGIGSKMLRHILDELTACGAKRFWCDARESALDFYRRFGLEPFGERFYKADVAYFKMELVFDGQ